MRLILTILAASLVVGGVLYYQQYTNSETEVQAMRDSVEQSLKVRAKEYYKNLKMECAKSGGRLPCYQKALLECRDLYGDRCQGN